MTKVLFATQNKNKVKRLRNFLGKSRFEIISLANIPQQISEPVEIGKNGMEVAKLKAYFYYNSLDEKMPVITQDDTLLFYNINGEKQVKISIKLPVIEKFGEFNDENAIKFYTEIAKRQDGEVKMSFIYGHGYCDGTRLIAKQSQLDGVLVGKPSTKLDPGYFLTAIVKVCVLGKYKYISELTDEEHALIDSDLKKSVSSLLKNTG